MENQGKFLEMLQEIKAIAASQQNRLTKEEIRAYLRDEGLSEEKLQAVYHYLGENHIAVEGYDFVTDKLVSPKRPDREAAGKKRPRKPAAAGEGGMAAPGTGGRREANMRLYHREIAQFSDGLEGDEEVVLAFLCGDASLRSTVVERYLQKVVAFAGKYRNRSVALDEIVAEGNVGLMMAVRIVEQNPEEYILPDGHLDAGKFFGVLDMEITQAMESYIDEMTASKDWENAVLAKTNLLHEATKYMAEEIGRMPTVEELSEYTKIAEEEIRSIRGLSQEL